MTPSLLIDASHTVRNSVAVCARCGQVLRFFAEPRYGKSMQECVCGILPLQRHQEVPVYIPPEMIAEERPRMSMQRVRKKCKAPNCGRSFIARAHDGSDTCSDRCRTFYRRARGIA